MYQIIWDPFTFLTKGIDDPWTKSFLITSQEWDLTKIFYEDLHKISSFGRSSLNFFGKPCEDFKKKIFYEDFGLKYFLLKIFTRSALIFFKRSSNNFFLKYCVDLWKIFSSNIFEILVRSSFNIFLRSTEDLLVFVLILKKN